MSSSGNEVDPRPLTGNGSAPSTPNDSKRGLAEPQEKGEHGREEILVKVQHRIESYEKCVAAITATTTSLHRLSEHLDTMHQATQQLNAFTGGWLAVWKRPSV